MVLDLLIKSLSKYSFSKSWIAMQVRERDKLKERLPANNYNKEEHVPRINLLQFSEVIAGVLHIL